ncbi:hypothetical protein JI952_005306 [Escherichia coli]|nr:hypothetical protein [Escherichia coli]
MLKILVIDRCHFTRTGIEALLNHSGRFSSSFLVSGINNLLLAKEHILQWKPHLVIADLYSFISETHSSRHCCKVSDEAAFCLIQRPYISKTLLTRRISPRGSP